MKFKLIFLLISFQFLTSCTSIKPTVVKNKKTQSQKSQTYLPERILVMRPIISGSKYSITVRDVNIGFPLRFHAPIVVADYKITPTKEEFKIFRNTLDRLNVWKWKKKYYSPRTEGWSNRVILKYPDKQVDVKITSKNPENYTKFIEALLKLVNYKKHALNNKEFMSKLNALKRRNKRITSHCI